MLDVNHSLGCHPRLVNFLHIGSIQAIHPGELGQQGPIYPPSIHPGGLGQVSPIHPPQEHPGGLGLMLMMPS